MKQKNVYTVARVNKYIANLISGEPLLEHITVSGEVSNPTYHGSGHIYFDIKDEYSKLSCVMFRSARKGLSFPMKKGDKVLVTGRIGVYSQNGTYQLYATAIERAGEGELYLRFLALKKELEEMGMFDSAYKKPLPKYPGHIGVVTAPTGAAVRDIIRICRRRNPSVHITLFPALVQGEGAAASVSKGIAFLDSMGVDVIIAGRGGGSIEDLWAFNEEEVARAIFSCNTPVISAVGHETDTTIADYVADIRAATPSEAAEIATGDMARAMKDFASYRERLYTDMSRKLSDAMQRADHMEEKLIMAHPARRIDKHKAVLSQKMVMLKSSMERALFRKRHRLELLAKELDGVSPAKRLSDGYSYLVSNEGKNIRSVEDVDVTDVVTAYVSDGKIQMNVSKVEKHD